MAMPKCPVETGAGSPRDVLRQFLDRHARLDVAHVRLAEHQLVEGNVARGAEGDLLFSGHRDISATGQPGATLPTSKPVTENPAHLLLYVKQTKLSLQRSMMASCVWRSTEHYSENLYRDWRSATNCYNRHDCECQSLYWGP